MKKYKTVGDLERTLRAPLECGDIKCVVRRLDEVFGADGWSSKYSAWLDEKDGPGQSIICELECYVFLPEGPDWGKHGLHKVTKRDGAAMTGEKYAYGIEEAFDKSLARAAMQLGINSQDAARCRKTDA